MTSKTFERRLQQLIEELSKHPYRDEVLQLAADQLQDDTLVLIHN
jgi:hypothetical protein